ncbi:MAG: hypothetical protein C0433_19655 [Cyclobacterium sp.]|nr:hypothetical protein [Cyclobacterium sp.]
MKNRKEIYYWKCDRPSASKSNKIPIDINQIYELISDDLDLKNLNITPFEGQGNHITYIIDAKTEHFFLRIENGSEGDIYMDREAQVLADLKSIGIPVPSVIAVDASRKKYPFSFQVLEFINFKDLNTLYKLKEFPLESLAFNIGQYIALWQAVEPAGFGLFDPKLDPLTGLHSTYSQYFLKNFDKHVSFLQQSNFLENEIVGEIYDLVQEYGALLELDHGVLVHKDLAFWNILGTETKIHSFIDWDDVISGDPTDDISLLACFHKGSIIHEVIKGFNSVRPLPIDFELRFWLHLLRNMIVKAVIRVRDGFFNRTDDLFLIPKGMSGEMFREFTKERIKIACLGLKKKIKILDL